MKLLQKSLVVVILVELLVVAQLYFINSEKGDVYYSFLKNPLSIVKKKDSQKDNLLIDFLLNELSKDKIIYCNLHFINEHLALLESEKEKRVHKNICKKIEQNAKRFLGYRYVWGATGPNKFDCSGFTQKVFKIVGINLPRVSREQAKVGKYVSFDRLKKGDIIFFDTKHKKTGEVNHVGIYLEDGKFIHASSGGKRVMITSFKQRAFYKNRFLWGRRII